jgi:hypothetical protein
LNVQGLNVQGLHLARKRAPQMRLKEVLSRSALLPPPSDFSSREAPPMNNHSYRYRDFIDTKAFFIVGAPEPLSQGVRHPCAFVLGERAAASGIRPYADPKKQQSET